MVNGELSEPSDVLSGVPQGTVLGPILFLMLINDIDKDIVNKVSLFADDTRLTGEVDTENDVEALQADLNKIYAWQTENNMLFNGKKFEMLRFGKNDDLKSNTVYFSPGYEDIIEVKESLRDLGVIMSDSSNFKDHINKVCTTVKQKFAWILRTFKSRDTNFMKLMWKSLVQGHIDYCSQLYMPIQSTEMMQLENLQKCFTKRIPEVQSLDYWQRLKYLRIYSQNRRLERYRIIYTWKILENLVPNCGLEFSVSERRGRCVNVPTLKGSKRIQNLREQSFQVHGPKLFNCLPHTIRNITRVSVEDFKEKLDQYLSTIPDEPNVDGLTPGTCDLYTAKPSNSIIDQSRGIRIRKPGN